MAVALTPTAEGTLAKTPLLHLVVYMADRGLTGSIVFRDQEAEHVVLFRGGSPAKIRTSEQVAPLGRVLFDLGLIDEGALNDSLRELGAAGSLHGQVLLRRGDIDESSLIMGLRAQVIEKMAYLFRLPPETAYAFYQDADLLEAWGGAENTPVDPLGLVSAGVRIHADHPTIDATLARLGNTPLRLHPDGDITRFAFTSEEMSGVEVLRAKPLSLPELIASGAASAQAIRLTVYALLVTRHLGQVTGAAKPVGIDFVTESERARGIAAGEPSSGKVAVARVKLRPRRTGETAAVAGLRLGTMPAPSMGQAERSRSTDPFLSTSTSSAPQTGSPPTPIPPSLRSSMLATPSPSPMPPAAPAPSTVSPMPPPPLVSSIPPVSRPPAISYTPPPATPAPQVPPTSSVPPRSFVPTTSYANQSSRPSRPAFSRPSPPPPTTALSPELLARRETIYRRAMLIDREDYFTMLGVGRDATPPVIESSYHALAKIWHSDRIPAELDDMRDHASKVFARMNEAFETLSDPERRKRYADMSKGGGGTPEELDKVQRIVDAATDFQRAEIYLKKRDLTNAEAYAQRAFNEDPDQSDYAALYVNLLAMKRTSPEEPVDDLVKILDAALAKHGESEKAYYARGMLLKRMGRIEGAMADFRAAAQRNPQNLDALRELRLYEMRRPKHAPRKTPSKGPSKPPSKPPSKKDLKDRKDSMLSGLGKLFKR